MTKIIVLTVEKSKRCSSSIVIFAHWLLEHTKYEKQINFNGIADDVRISFVYAQDAQQQEMPPKHRGLHPRLQADGSVIDDDGKTLGSIKNGKVCDVSGKVIGVISGHGDVTTANGKQIGKIQKDGSFKSMTVM